MPAHYPYSRRVVAKIHCEEWNRGRGRRTRWVLIELECKHGRVELESGHNDRRDCRICRMLAEATAARTRRAA